MKMDIAQGLLSIGAVKLSPHQPFTYASGLRGPIYCDNRLLLSHVDLREKVISYFLSTIKQNNLESDLIGGIATAGIPHAAFVADRLKKPMVYVRPKAKGHGKKNQVEGDYQRGQTVLLFEDLVNQGTSLQEAISGVKDAELEAHHCLCIVDYQTKEAKKRLNDLSLQLWSLTDFTTMINCAYESKKIDDEGLKLLLNWHDDPQQWSNQAREQAR